MKPKYNKTTWIDGTTPINAEKLNKIENALENISVSALSPSDIVTGNGISSSTIEDCNGDMKLSLELNIKSGDGIKVEPIKENNKTNLKISLNSYPILESLNVNKEDDYLYSISYPTLDYDFANKYFTSEYDGGQSFACTSIRKGNWFGRNLDFVYNDLVDFVVYTNPIQGRHKTLGVASCIPGFSKEKLESRDINDLDWKLIPFQVFDGINDCGVFANINVVPKVDIQPTTGTHPGASRTIYQAMLVRYILDNYDTAENAVRDIAGNVNVIGTTNTFENYEFHFMVGDQNRTYVLEFIDNEAKIVEFKNESEKENWGSLDNTSKINLPIMTNFYLYGVIPNNDNSICIPANNINGLLNPIEKNKITRNGSGLERYNLSVENYNSINSKNTMLELLKNIRESKSYSRNTSPFWYSELIGSGGVFKDENNNLIDLTAGSTKSQFEAAIDSKGNNFIDRVLDLFENRNRDSNSIYYGTWHTTHSSVYDIENKTLTITTQENYNTVKTFSFNSPIIHYQQTNGITAERPTNVEKGYMFFDLTLNKPIWWSGSSWVDCNGDEI